MYNKVKNNVFDGILTAVFNEFIAEEMRLLPTDDELSVMYPTSEKQLKQYRKKAKQIQRKAPTLSVYLKRIAVIALAVISVVFGVLMTNEGVRASIVESFITWYDKFVEFDFSRYEEPEKEEETDPLAAIDALVIGYVPEGYILSESVEDPGFRQYIYMTETGEYLVISMYTSENTGIGLDNENSDLEKLTLDGKDMYLSYNDTDQYGSIVFGNKMYTVSVSGLIAKDELIKVAENITAKQPQVDAEEPTKTFKDLAIGYIPEGFELTNETEDDYVREYTYMSENGDYILVGLYDSEHSETSLDTKNSEYEVISVNGYDAYVVYNSDE